MEKEHEEILQSHTVKLTDNLEPKPLVLYLYEKDIIDRRDREEILSKETRYDMSEALLFKLMRKGPEAFPELVKGLEENQPFLACILLEAVKHREILQKHTGKLTDSLQPIPLINYLHEKGIIDDIDRIEILSKETQCKMSKALLFKLRRKGSEAYRELVKGLEEKQPSLACILLREGKYKDKIILLSCDYRSPKNIKIKRNCVFACTLMDTSSCLASVRFYKAWVHPRKRIS